MTIRRLLSLTLLAAACLLAQTAATAPRRRLPHGQWEAWMLGLRSPEQFAAIADDIRGQTAHVAIATPLGVHRSRLRAVLQDGSELTYHSGSEYTAISTHDDDMLYEALLVARHLRLSLHIHVFQTTDDLPIAACFEQAALQAPVVFGYQSYWRSPDVAAITAAVSRHPDTLFIAPYGEIKHCPPTASSYQGHARNAIQTGLHNLILTAPLAPDSRGRLLHPLRRSPQDTATITFIAPTSWATSHNVTCPSVSVTVVLAAYTQVASNDALSAEFIIYALEQSLAQPDNILTERPDFHPNDIPALARELADLSSPPPPQRALLYPGFLNLWNLHLFLNNNRP